MLRVAEQKKRLILPIKHLPLLLEGGRRGWEGQFA